MSETVQNLNKSSETLYKLAQSSAEFRAAHAFLREQGAEKLTLGFPTVLAMEGKDIVGLLSTAPRKDMIQAGPMVIKKDRPRRYTVLRLMEVYELILQSFGVQTYTIFVDYGSAKLMDMLLRLPLTDVIGEDADGVLFARRLKQHAA